MCALERIPRVDRPRVRKAREADAAAIAMVHVASWRAAYAGILDAGYLASLDRRALTVQWGRWLAGPAGSKYGESVWVAEGAGVVGFCQAGPCYDDLALSGFAGEIFMLYVHPCAWGQGIGRALLERALGAVADAGLFWAVIWVLESNAAARGFYESCGFALDGGRMLDVIGVEELPVVRYARALNPVLVGAVAGCLGAAPAGHR